MRSTRSSTVLIWLVDAAFQRQRLFGVNLRITDNVVQVPLHCVNPVFRYSTFSMVCGWYGLWIGASHCRSYGNRQSHCRTVYWPPLQNSYSLIIKFLGKVNTFISIKKGLRLHFAAALFLLNLVKHHLMLPTLIRYSAICTALRGSTLLYLVASEPESQTVLVGEGLLDWPTHIILASCEQRHWIMLVGLVVEHLYSHRQQ